MYYLFGNNYNKVEHNTIKTASKIVLLHIPSIERAKEILIIANLYAVQIYINSNNSNDDKIRYSCCGKVIIVNGDTDREIICYILEETNKRWKV